MRLKHIKVAGFKSFVDPTTLILPQNMTCIVGPNGCGKSNTIDAVRWVMGESSAKHLRGESTTDVIFAGSSGRKPVSQASVELLFDNSDRTLVGEYAQYTEVSVKRVVTRDGQSQYFLNNSKCRKRDVTELFLGTGLGPRSYAIIEQGMISNLITAKPEELRHFLEEAAGISKYKERRRETELRMKRTRENLERLYDIREELDRQLQKLEKQAADAETFKSLQAQKRQKQAELAYIRRQKIQAKKDALDERVRQEEVQLEASYSQRRESETALEAVKVEMHGFQDDFYEKQKVFYQVGTEITQCEEAQKHQERRKASLNAEKNQIQEALSYLQGHEGEDIERKSHYEEQLERDEPELEILEGRIEATQERLEMAQDAYKEWQFQWQKYVQESSASREASQVAQAKIIQFEKSVTRLDQQQQHLRENLEALDNSEDVAKAEALRITQAQTEEQISLVETELDQLREKLKLNQEARDQQGQSLSQYRAALDQAQGRYDSLLGMQKRILKPADNAQEEWLQQTGLDASKPLATYLDVQRDWQSAVEKLFGPLLTGLVADSEQFEACFLHQSPQSNYVLKTFAFEQANTDVNPEIQLQKLTDVIQLKAPLILPAWVQGVYLAQNTAEASHARVHLKPHESILMPDGSWSGYGWCLMGQGDERPGLLVVQQDLDDLSTSIDALQEQVAQVQEVISELKYTADEMKTQEVEHEMQLQELLKKLGHDGKALSAIEAKAEQILLQKQRMEADLRQNQTQLESELNHLQQCRGEQEDAVQIMAEYEDKRRELEDSQEELQQAVTMNQDSLAQDQDRARLLAESIRFASTSIEGIDRQLGRVASQSQHHQDRLAQLEKDLAEAEAEQVNIDNLPLLLEKRKAAEDEMTKAKDLLEHHQSLQSQYEKNKSQAQDAIDKLRTALEGLRIQVQAQQSDLEHIQHELNEFDVTLDQLELAVPEHAEENHWRRAIADLERKVQGLGAINLAAVEEFQTQKERKVYMDEQYADLENALFTLEEAIEKIDQETRERFSTTFNQINEGMGELFPRLFGGGQAKLELVGDDILTAGVAIMARPPGKKNTSIHMLSGGEKALTAISLVFAIFQLNPSPFCMLDEVDAPLDDANVGRYADMVKHMSEKVQFIYISHNKIAMEKADQLMGVTMQEPGVSRLVSVDIGEASKMAAM